MKNRTTKFYLQEIVQVSRHSLLRIPFGVLIFILVSAVTYSAVMSVCRQLGVNGKDWAGESVLLSFFFTFLILSFLGRMNLLGSPAGLRVELSDDRVMVQDGGKIFSAKNEGLRPGTTDLLKVSRKSVVDAEGREFTLPDFVSVTKISPSRQSFILQGFAGAPSLALVDGKVRLVFITVGGGGIAQRREVSFFN